MVGFKTLSIIIIGVLFLNSHPDLGNTPDISLFQSVYPNTRTFSNFTCATCHVNIAQNSNLNKYGTDYKTMGRGLFSSFVAIEPLDSDGDGFTNIQEISAGSNPGDPTSNPNNVPAPVVITGGGGGGVGARGVGASTDLNNKNMLGSTGCGIIVNSKDDSGQGGSGGNPIVSLLLYLLPLFLIAILRVGSQNIFNENNLTFSSLALPFYGLVRRRI